VLATRHFCASVIALLSSPALLGCNDVTRFSTAADESYCGSIVPGPFVREGFGPGVRMRMSFDADHLGDKPGVISTDDSLFDKADLRPIPQLATTPCRPCSSAKVVCATCSLALSQRRVPALGCRFADGQRHG